MYRFIAFFTLMLISTCFNAPAFASNVPAEIAKEIAADQQVAKQASSTTKAVKIQAVKKKKPTKKYGLDYIGDTEKHIAVYEDTLIHLARKNNLGFIEIRSANPHLDPWIPGEDAKIILPKRHILPNAPKEGVVINLAEMRLYIFPTDGSAPDTFPIGIGREGLQTPVGRTEIIRKAIGPRWRPTERMRTEDPSLPEVIEAGPNNPLGTHALYLGWPQYAIHGTNRPYGIGRRVSSGCIRMYPEGIVKAYDLINTGTSVTVVDQPIKVGWADDMLYVEAHAGQELADDMERLGKVPEQELTSDQMARIKSVAKEHANEINWDIVAKAYNARSGYPVPVLTKQKETAKAIVIVKAEKTVIAEAKTDKDTAPVKLDIAEDKKDRSVKTKESELSAEDLENLRKQKAALLLKASYND